MDATNRQVIAQLQDIARNFFDSLELEPGTYTAAELAANVRTGDKQKRPIYRLEEVAKLDELAACSRSIKRTPAHSSRWSASN